MDSKARVVWIRMAEVLWKLGMNQVYIDANPLAINRYCNKYGGAYEDFSVEE